MRSARSALLGVTVLVAATAVAVVLRSTSACALPFPAGGALVAAERSGKATFYGNAAPGGACSFPAPPADHLTAAAGPADYAKAAGCGGYFDVSGTRGTVRVKVDNLCPECQAGHLDLSNEAFARLDDLGKGVAPISYRQVVDPALTGGLSFRVKEGSSQWWLALLVDNHGNPLRSVEVRGGSGSWLALRRADYNYWIAAGGAGTGPFQVRVTDVRGHVATASGIAVRPGQVQRTSVRLYGSGGGSTASGGGVATTRAAPAPKSAGTVTTRTPATRTPSPRQALGAQATGPATASRTAPRPVTAAQGTVAVAQALAEPAEAGEATSTSPTPIPTSLTAALAGDTASPPITTADRGWWC